MTIFAISTRSHEVDIRSFMVPIYLSDLYLSNASKSQEHELVYTEQLQNIFVYEKYVNIEEKG